jgi:demethylmenaquinone methyltransferase/2-methoxy-6-polyprenyl-1,4-benzoquinol methylase
MQAEPLEQRPVQERALEDGGSGAMFDRIAPRYDLLNRVMSLGLDRGWRKRLARALAPALADGGIVLDLATGTGDVALALARHYSQIRVVGVDPSGEMLRIGQQKRKAALAGDRVSLLMGDGQQLPFGDQTFAASCIAFGIRNVPDRERALREMRRITRPGGVVAILELGAPRRGLLAPLTRLHVNHIVPRLGAWLSRWREYRYLPQSMAAFPPPEQFSALMSAAGWQEVQIETMGMGAVQLFTGRRGAG